MLISATTNENSEGFRGGAFLQRRAQSEMLGVKVYTAPDGSVAAVLQILYHRWRRYLSAEVVMGIYNQSEISIHQSSKSQSLFTIAHLQLLYSKKTSVSI